ncbi:MAG TPA: caspase family protein [Myxococcales bacterium]|jgi:hypothetical protein
MIRSLATLAALLLAAGTAQAASPVRYALIVGNNSGQTPPGIELPELRHAQQEAQVLRDRLVALGNFDASPQRTALLTGASREEILKAAQAIAAQHRADRQALGEVPTLFAFFFTGHGLSGQLLTKTGPLVGSDLATIFGEVGATFTVGVFDACFSGSLDLAALSSKGLALTPGFNAFEALPQEVLNAQGTMWFASSRPDQVSYEDSRLGGVFTHYFIEAMERAPSTGFGITLDDVWEYARAHTQSHTRNAARPQTPQKLVRNLTSTGPLYFSFPAQRRATLAFEAGVVGRFLVRYENGQLSELVAKSAGEPMRVAVYPADLVLERLDDGGRQSIHLLGDETVWIRPSEGWSTLSSVGLKQVALVAKGPRLDGLVLTHEESRWSGLVELGYRLSVGPRYGAIPTHAARAGFRVDRGIWQLRLGYGYGRETHAFEAWSYLVQRHALELGFGPAATFEAWRVGPVASASVGWTSFAYGDGAKRSQTAWAGSLAANVLWQPLHLPLYVQAQAGAMGEWSRPAAPLDGRAVFSVAPEFALGLAVELF